MVILYDIETGVIKQTIDRTFKPPEGIPDGLGALVVHNSPGVNTLNYKVDPVSLALERKSDEEIEEEIRDIQQEHERINALQQAERGRLTKEIDSIKAELEELKAQVRGDEISRV